MVGCVFELTRTCDGSAALLAVSVAPGDVVLVVGAADCGTGTEMFAFMM